MATTIADIHPDIIQTHILSTLDAGSLFAVSSYLRSLSSDHNLWSDISKYTWPSITDPRVDELISTFSGGHQSFFEDSFPSLMITQLNKSNYLKQQDSSSYLDSSTHPKPSRLVSTVDIRYQTEVIYSKVQFTDTTSAFLSSKLLIEVNEEDEISNGLGSKPITGFEVDGVAGVNEATLAHLKESMTLSWIVIDPILKRAGNVSSIKPVTVKNDWMSSDTILQYATVLPGCDPNEMVKCRIQVVLGVSNERVGLQVKTVTMKLMDLDSHCLNGRDFLVILQSAILVENNVRRKVMGDDDILRITREFKEMKKIRKEWVGKEKEKRKNVFIMDYVGLLVSFCISVYLLG